MQLDSLNTHDKLCTKTVALVFVCMTLILAGCSSTTRTAALEPVVPGPLTARAAVSATPPGYYVVAPGDTLASISSAYGRDVSVVATWNAISVDAILTPGQRLRVGPPATAPVARPEIMPAPSAEPKADAFSWPARGPIITTFGTAGLKGIRIGGTAGDPIKSVQQGRVVYLGRNIQGYGNLIVIKHDEHLLTAYGNVGRMRVREGATVNKGQVIADMGSQADGQSSFVFEVRKDRNPVDPKAYLGAQEQ